MENQNVNNQPQEQNQPQGWRDVIITPDMPLAAIVQFFNILNQRLCNIEDNLLINQPDGGSATLTELYRIQADYEKEMLAKQQEENANGGTQGE